MVQEVKVLGINVEVLNLTNKTHIGERGGRDRERERERERTPIS